MKCIMLNGVAWKSESCMDSLLFQNIKNELVWWRQCMFLNVILFFEEGVLTT